ncbi:D-alanine--D-alanine ligase family protein [Scatolibacter rhodanostii]|uniref:D-alanine--D-alanine ligase family protein n=1 Tax=Scatolibacter rhodanostii TaxID=2014781 RepID=UPI000C085BCF|nr:D-alanine--D-alanine ligase family protein [Scatolibacter rhodanostii]
MSSQKKLTVAVIFGGASSEHEVSLMSVTSVLANLSEEKYEKVMLGITKNGHWLLYQGSIDKIITGEWEQDESCVPAFLSPDSHTHGIIVCKDHNTEILPVDVIFPVLHGKNGEDGTIQGLFQLSGIPFVGCDTLSSAICMDKAVTHSLLTATNIEQANYLWFYASRYETAADVIRNKIVARLEFPVFVKPANAGSSVGVSRVNSADEIDAAVRKAAKEDSKIVVESGIMGQEVECSVLGNGYEAKASIVGEIGASAEFYDYDDKYRNGTSQLYIPARISEETAEKIRETAVRAYRWLGCSGLARVDFFVRESDGAVILNEINTLPGFTSISMYLKLWEATGLPFTELLDELITCAQSK